jgi:hypothetical protein
LLSIAIDGRLITSAHIFEFRGGLQPEGEKSLAARELNDRDLDRVAGGIITIGGSTFDRVALNPHPLPPRVLSTGFASLSAKSP